MKFKSLLNPWHEFEFIIKWYFEIRNMMPFHTATTDPRQLGIHRFKIAEQSGLKVIDDPILIRTCSNKAILHDLFIRIIYLRQVYFISRDYFQGNYWFNISTLGLPVIIKTHIRDFHPMLKKQVMRHNSLKYQSICSGKPRFSSSRNTSNRILDWRVGILRNEVLYLWQVLHSRRGWKVKIEDNEEMYGRHYSIIKDSISPGLKELSIKLSKCVAMVFMVWCKRNKWRIQGHRINDNPSIYDGYEDTVDGIFMRRS